jgi:FAD/FMN-containing dehydrogenase
MERDAGQASQALDHWRKETKDYQGYTIMMAGPRDWLTLIDAWGEPQESQDLMRRLKHRWDPAMILNPGEFNGL